MRLCSVVTLVALALAGTAFAQEDTIPAITVELKFSGKDTTTIEMVSKTEGEAPVPKQLGVPQLAHIWFEALGPDDEVIYADELRDPRVIKVDRKDPGSTHNSIRLEEATTFIRMPAGSGRKRPKQLVIYKRTSEDSDKARTELLRAGL